MISAGLVNDILSALKATTWRRKACFLRHDIRSTGRAHWGAAHWRWLSEVLCPPPAPPSVLQDDVRAVHEHPARRQRLAQDLHEHVPAWRLHAVVEALQALRGVPGTVAVTMVADMGDLTRCDPPRALRKCLGLLPAESASGARRQQGSMPQAGPTHARKALGEGAWASRSPAKGSRPLQRRLETQPTIIQDIRWQAQGRQCTRSQRRVARGTQATVVTGAMARERVGGMGAMAQESPVTPYVPKSDRHGPRNAAGFLRASAAAQPRCGVTRVSVKRLGKDPRAASEAGTRRRHVRWEPTHGEQQDQPSCLPGSGSADAQRTKNIMKT